MSSQPTSPAGPPPGDQTAPGGGPAPAPSEQELREAYEAELGAITSAEMIFQATVSLLNVAGYRLAGSRSRDPESSDAATDLDQVRDAIDAVRALLPVLERTTSAAELKPLRDALSQIQMAYAREVVPDARADAPAGQSPPAAGAPQGEPPSSEPPKGPAESSGRLWVPGR